jgi:uncharacterized protein
MDRPTNSLGRVRLPRALVAVLLAAAVLPVAAVAQDAAAPVPPVQQGAAPEPTPAGRPTSSAGAPSEAARLEAQALGKLLGFGDQTASLLATVRLEIIQQLASSNNRRLDDTARIIDDVIMPDFRAELAKLDAALVDVWASNFTIAELKDMQNFYHTPTGQKLLRTTPTLNQQSIAATKVWAEPLFLESARKHADELARRGLRT